LLNCVFFCFWLQNLPLILLRSRKEIGRRVCMNATKIPFVGYNVPGEFTHVEMEVILNTKRTMKKACFILILMLLYVGIDSVYAQRFIVIYAIDVEDIHIGGSCLTDYSKMDTTFQEIAKNLHFSYEARTLMRQDLNLRTLESTINSLQVDANDVLVFYYSGHGFAELSQQSPYPALYLHGEETTTLDAIHRRLKQKKARLLLSFADCCNNIIVKFKGLPAVRPLIERSISVENDILRKLFKEARGAIILSSSRRNEKAGGFSSTGGFYTCMWKTALVYAKSHNSHISWQTLLEDAENRLQNFLTNDLTNNLTNVEKLQKISQHSQWEITSGDEPIVPTNNNPVVTEVTQEPKVSFSEMNQFLNTLADERVSYVERDNLLGKGKNQYFGSNADVRVFVKQIDNKTAAIPITNYLDKVIVSANLIKQINIVESHSSFSTEGKYQHVTLQEIR
jgi:uncharacterized protein YcfL